MRLLKKKVGEYQTYIFGNANPNTKISQYLDLSASHKNPNDATVNQGNRQSTNTIHINIYFI